MQIIPAEQAAADQPGSPARSFAAVAQAHCIIVVPCYNEAERLRGDEFLAFTRIDPRIHFLFVNDGSSDATLPMLQQLCDGNDPALRLLDKPKNGGKAEAVRDGFNAALRSNQPQLEYIGFWDADLATPLETIPHLLAKLRRDTHLHMVFGSRVRLLGRAIHRKLVRHYLGRLFATFASITLGLPIYDTQCGAKIFRVSPTLVEAMTGPFVSRWIFDVEIVARYLRLKGRRFCSETIFEYPLHAWHDVGGSKVRPSDFFLAIADLARIRRRYLVPPPPA